MLLRLLSHAVIRVLHVFVLQWFWEVVENLTQEERVLLLQFVTGRYAQLFSHATCIVCFTFEVLKVSVGMKRLLNLYIYFIFDWF